MSVNARSKASQGARPARGQRVLASLVAGSSLDQIGVQEKISRKRVETILRAEMQRRWVAPAQDFAKVQIARLETMIVKLIRRVQDGEVDSIDRVLKILDRLDRYHGFTRAIRATVEPYGDEERERLLDKINAVAARLYEEDKAGE